MSSIFVIQLLENGKCKNNKRGCQAVARTKWASKCKNVVLRHGNKFFVVVVVVEN